MTEQYKTLYLVSSGYYSSYGVRAVFDDKNLAQKFIDSFKLSDYDKESYRIEEYELNPGAEDLKNNRKPFEVYMDKEGNVKIIRQAQDAYDHGHSISWNCNVNHITVTCFADDSIHAIKIANEKRTELIALNKWGE